MDKQTLSNYGWVIITVLVLAVMIALATPFGSYIKEGAKSTLTGLFESSENALNTGLSEAGVSVNKAEFGGVPTVGENTTSNIAYGINHPALNPTGDIIPKGAVYYRGIDTIIYVHACIDCGIEYDHEVEKCDSCNSSDGLRAFEYEEILNQVESFPHSPQKGDIYVYEGLIYYYGQYQNHNGNFYTGSMIDFYREYCGNYVSNPEWCVVSTSNTTAPSAVLETIIGSPVNVLWNELFQGNTALEVSPLLPDTITDMNRMFYGCTSLKTITNIPQNVINMDTTFANCAITKTPYLPDTITNLNYTFGNCLFLEEITNIPKNTTLLFATFSGCTSLTKIPHLPDTITSLSYAFSDCTSLTEISHLPNTITSLDYTFSGCTSLTETPCLPNTITALDGTFSNCTSLKTISNLPQNLTSMQETFAGCTSLINVPYIPDSISTLHVAFAGCSSLKTIPNLPASWHGEGTTFLECVSLETLPPIPDGATYFSFYGCSSLKTIPNIPSNISSFYFEECASLSELPVIPKNVQYIFINNCPALTTITYEGTIEEWNNISFDGQYSSITTIICSNGVINL